MINIFNLQTKRLYFIALMMKYKDTKMLEYLNKSSIFFDSYQNKPIAHFDQSMLKDDWSQEKGEKLWLWYKWFLKLYFQISSHVFPITEAKNYNFVDEKEMFEFLNKIEKTQSWIRLVRLSNKVTYSWRLQIENNIIVDKQSTDIFHDRQRKDVNTRPCHDCIIRNINDDLDKLYKLGVCLKNIDNYETASYYYESKMKLFNTIK